MESNKRSLLKALSWRATGTLDTIVVSFILTGNPFWALKIGVIELLTKIALYFIHERAWTFVQWGYNPLTSQENPMRSAFKALTWRTTGTLDTITISFLIIDRLELAIGIGTVEIVTKSILYFAHERVWQKITWGKIIPNSSLVTQKIIHKREA